MNVSQWKNLEDQKARNLPDMVIGKKMAGASIFEGRRSSRRLQAG
jgi:hypothetical protein